MPQIYSTNSFKMADICIRVGFECEVLVQENVRRIFNISCYSAHSSRIKEIT